MHKQQYLLAFLATILLTGFTLLYYLVFDRHEQLSGDLIAEHFLSAHESLDEKPQANISFTSDESILLINHNSKQSTQHSWVIERPMGEYVRMVGLFSIKGVVAGDKAWHKARVILTGRTEKRKWQWFPGSALFSESDSLEHFSRTKVIRLPQKFDALRITIQLARASGQLDVHALSLHAVKETKASIFGEYLLFGLWVMCGIYCLSLLYRLQTSYIALPYD